METPQLSATALPVFERIIALRQIEGSLGVHSQRTQRKLLLSLNDKDLAEVCLAIKQTEVHREEMHKALAPLGAGR